jgi:hypothetical protein
MVLPAQLEFEAFVPPAEQADYATRILGAEQKWVQGECRW